MMRFVPGTPATPWSRSTGPGDLDVARSSFELDQEVDVLGVKLLDDVPELAARHGFAQGAEDGSDPGSRLGRLDPELLRHASHELVRGDRLRCGAHHDQLPEH